MLRECYSSSSSAFVKPAGAGHDALMLLNVTANVTMHIGYGSYRIVQPIDDNCIVPAHGVWISQLVLFASKHIVCW